MPAGFNEARLRPVKKGDTISARAWNEILRLLKRTITGPLVRETSTGWHIRRDAAIEEATSDVNFCKIVDDGGSQVLKKSDPANPSTLTDFDVDIGDVYEAITGTALDSAGYLDDTFVIVYKDSDGAYFAHPFALWRPYGT